jgi:hypothetical protein
MNPSPIRPYMKGIEITQLFSGALNYLTRVGYKILGCLSSLISCKPLQPIGCMKVICNREGGAV